MTRGQSWRRLLGTDTDTDTDTSNSPGGPPPLPTAAQRFRFLRYFAGLRAAVRPIRTDAHTVRGTAGPDLTTPRKGHPMSSPRTASPGNPFGLLSLANRPDTESGPGQCDSSPNTRHRWHSLGIGAQSCEMLICRHCGESLLD